MGSYHSYIFKPIKAYTVLSSHYTLMVPIIAIAAHLLDLSPTAPEVNYHFSQKRG